MSRTAHAHGGPARVSSPLQGTQARVAAAVAGAVWLSWLGACGGAKGPTSSPPHPPEPVAVAAHSEGRDAPADPEGSAAVPVSPRNPAWGSRSALVTIVEYADFQCPYCVRSEPALLRAREVYGPEVLRVVWKNLPLPFHEHARPAAEAAMGVFALGGADAFWRFHRAAFEGSRSLEAAGLEEWAKTAGVADMGAWRSGMQGHAWAAEVEADMAEAEKLGVNGTPTFFVNGVQVVGQQSFEELKVLIDGQLKAAQAKVAAGTPRALVYVELAQENRVNAPAPPPEEDDPPEDTKTVFKVPVGRSPARGGAAALVTIVEFGDYECPFCGRVEATLTALRRKYGDDLRVVFKDAPLDFHEHALPAAEAALEVRAEKGDAAFWSMHDALFAQQKSLDDASLVALAVGLGARPEGVKAAIAKRTHQAEIDRDVDLADDFEAEGTPHFFINGRRLVGSQAQEKFEAIIDEEMKHAQGLRGGGTRPEALYEALVKDGKGPTPPPQLALSSSLPAKDPGRGPASAKVTVHEWADFECPFCARVEPTVDRLSAAYPGQLRFVWHDLPLPMHPDAPLAAQAGREALKQKGEQGFWALHDAMLKDQKALARSDLDGLASALKLDMGAWRAALDGGAHRAEVGADEAAAQEMKVSGTPTFVVVPRGASSGYFLSGAQAFEKFKKLVERALGEAK